MTALERGPHATGRAAPEPDAALEYDQAPCGYLTTTPEGVVVKVNATFCAWLGTEADQLLGRRFADLLTVGSRILAETHFTPLLRMQGTARDVALDVVRADRSRLPVLLNASVHNTPEGRPHLVRMAVFDATERRAYERDLVRTRDQQEAELQARAQQAARATATVSQIIDAATDTLLVATDPELVVTHFNRGAQRLLGHPAEEVVGRSMTGFPVPDEVLRHAEALGVSPDLATLVPALVRHGAPRDWAVGARDGEHRALSLSFTEIRDGQRLLGYLCAGEDVSVRLRTEAAQAAALRSEVESVARLEEADRVKDEVVSTISHELRTPISSIRGYGELLVDGDLGALSPAQADAVATVLRNAARLASLVDNLLYLDRDRSSQETPQRREPTDVAALVVEARHDVEQEAGDRDLGIDVHVPDGPAVVLGDPAELRRLVWNLADNAIKFTPDGGSITVEVTSTPAGTVLTVADTGIGMSEEDRQRVRARFYRSSEVYRLAVPGAGLGLSVVDTIVAAHGGTMDIASEHGRGTTVTVALPPYGRGGPTG